MRERDRFVVFRLRRRRVSPDGRPTVKSGISSRALCKKSETVIMIVIIIIIIYERRASDCPAREKREPRRELVTFRIFLSGTVRIPRSESDKSKQWIPRRGTRQSADQTPGTGGKWRRKNVARVPCRSTVFLRNAFFSLSRDSAPFSPFLSVR